MTESRKNFYLAVFVIVSFAALAVAIYRYNWLVQYDGRVQAALHEAASNGN